MRLAPEERHGQFTRCYRLTVNWGLKPTLFPVAIPRPERQHKPNVRCGSFNCFAPLIMSIIFRRGVASMASLKKTAKVVCIGRNYAYVQAVFLCGCQS